MSSPPSSKYHASISIEELFQQPSQQQHNWLLTYIDVFVLIVMLVITLIALSDFETEKEVKKAQNPQKQIKKPAPPKKTVTKKSIKKVPNEKKLKKDTIEIQEIKDFLEPVIKQKKQEQTLEHKKPDLPAIIKQEAAIIEAKQNIEQIELDPKRESQPRSLSENREPTAANPFWPAFPKNFVKERNYSPLIFKKPDSKGLSLATTTMDGGSAGFAGATNRSASILGQAPSDDSLQKQLNATVEQLGLTDFVDMKVAQGYAQLEIQDKILFQSSEATLLNAGEALLKKLTPLLDQSSGLIYIEGHTDNRPIKTSRFPSNWELGAARATSVLHYLTSQKLKASRLRAITYGDTKPIADNKTKEGREKNRRVSIVIKISDKIN